MSVKTNDVAWGFYRRRVPFGLEQQLVRPRREVGVMVCLQKSWLYIYYDDKIGDRWPTVVRVFSCTSNSNSVYELVGTVALGSSIVLTVTSDGKLLVVDNSMSTLNVEEVDVQTGAKTLAFSKDELDEPPGVAACYGTATAFYIRYRLRRRLQYYNATTLVWKAHVAQSVRYLHFIHDGTALLCVFDTSKYFNDFCGLEIRSCIDGSVLRSLQLGIKNWWPVFNSGQLFQVCDGDSALLCFSNGGEGGVMLGVVMKMSLQDCCELERYSIADAGDIFGVAMFGLAALPCGDVITVVDGGPADCTKRIRCFSTRALRRTWVLCVVRSLTQ